MTQPNVDFRSELAEHATALRALALRLVSTDDADDLTHDAMLAALSHRTAPRRTRPWLRQVLRNEARARRRSGLRRQAREDRAVLHDDVPSPEALVEQAQVAAAVRDALVGLDAPYRRALEARFYDDRTAADIARSEGCPAGTVRWRLQEGLRRMRSSLDARFEGREAWRGPMVAVLSFPIPEAAHPVGETTMITSPLFTKSALGILASTAVAGAAVLALAQRPSESAVAVPPERPQMAAASTAGGLAHSVHAAQVSVRNATPRGPTSGPRGIGPIEETPCEPCSEAGMPSFEAVAECQATHSVSATGRIDVHIELDGLRVEAAHVTSASEDDEGLAACLRDALPGSTASLHGEATAPGELNLVLLPDTAAVPENVDAPTPSEQAAERQLPTRTEGEAPTRTVVACGDYDCPFCDSVRATLDQVLDEYPDVELAWMHAPLTTHPEAMTAARAAVAARVQGKFWEMHEALFDAKGHTEDDVRRLATTIGLDLDQFDRDMAEPETLATIEAQRASCQAAGAAGTPSFFVDDTVMVGAQDIEAFRALLAE